MKKLKLIYLILWLAACSSPSYQEGSTKPVAYKDIKVRSRAADSELARIDSQGLAYKDYNYKEDQGDSEEALAEIPLKERIIRNIFLYGFELAAGFKSESSFLILSKDKLLTQEAFTMVRTISALIHKRITPMALISSQTYTDTLSRFKPKKLAIGDFYRGGSGVARSENLMEVVIGYPQTAALNADGASLTAASTFGIRSYDETWKRLEVFGLTVKTQEIEAAVDSIALRKEGSSTITYKVGNDLKTLALERETTFSVLGAFLFESGKPNPAIASSKTKVFQERAWSIKNNAAEIIAYLRILKFLGANGSSLNFRRAFFTDRSEPLREFYEEKIKPAIASMGFDPDTHEINAIRVGRHTLDVNLSKEILVKHEGATVTIPTKFKLKYTDKPNVLAVHGVKGVKENVFLNRDATLAMKELRLNTKTNQLELAIVGSFKFLFFDKTKTEVIKFNL